MESTLNRWEQDVFDPRAHDRIRRHTAAHVNERIDLLTEASLQKRVHAGREAVLARLEELDREWDVDRALMANFAVLSGVTLELARRHRGWMLLFRAQQFFFFWHTLVGWCPPLPLLRRLGFRSAKEIAAERTALMEVLSAQPDPAPAEA